MKPTGHSTLRETDRQESIAGPPYPKSTYAWYVIAVLTFIYIFSYIDRQILNLLVAPVRNDLHITDTQISLLIGIAFAAFYVTFGLPIGRIADSHSRRGLIGIGFFLWSLFAAGCGLARNFAELGLMRMGVGVGEASLAPAAYSLISDYFPPNRRALAMGVYNMGITLGNGTALVLGGIITGFTAGRTEWMLPLFGAIRSWQLVFLIIGLSGMACVPLIATVREPARRGTSASSKSVPFVEVLAYFKANWRTYVCHNLGITLLIVCAYATISWIPTFFIRHHHWTASKAGLWLGGMSTIFGSIGIFGAGWFANWLSQRGRRDACMFVAFLIPAAWLPILAGLLLAPKEALALALYAPSTLLATASNGVAPTALMLVTPQRMRGQASAIYIFLMSLIGLGLGPTAVAFCTDHVFHNDQAVGYSLLVVAAVVLPLASLLLWIGRGHYVASQDAAAAWQDAD